MEGCRRWKAVFCHGTDPTVYGSFPFCPHETSPVSDTNSINGCISVSSTAPSTETSHMEMMIKIYIMLLNIQSFRAVKFDPL